LGAMEGAAEGNQIRFRVSDPQAIIMDSFYLQRCLEALVVADPSFPSIHRVYTSHVALEARKRKITVTGT